MRLNDPLVTSIEYEGQEYTIDLSFNNVLDVLEVLNNNQLFEEHKLGLIMEFLIGESDLDLVAQAEIWQIVKEEYIEDKSAANIEQDALGNIIPMRKSAQMLDIEQDAKYIYASFRQIGINLFIEQGKMHWHEFQAILESLPEDTILQKIIQIRAWKPQKSDSSVYKRQMRELQEKYKLTNDDKNG